MATLIIRHNDTTLVQTPFEILADGIKLGDSVPGGSASFELSEGEHFITVGSAKNVNQATSVAALAGGAIGAAISTGFADKFQKTADTCVSLSPDFAAVIDAQYNGSAMLLTTSYQPVASMSSFRAQDLQSSRENLEQQLAAQKKKKKIFGLLALAALLLGLVLAFVIPEPVKQSFNTLRATGADKAGQYVDLSIEGYSSFVAITETEDGVSRDIWYCYLIDESDNLFLAAIPDSRFDAIDVAFDAGKPFILEGTLKKTSEILVENKSVRTWALEGAADIGVTDADFDAEFGPCYLAVDEIPTGGGALGLIYSWLIAIMMFVFFLAQASRVKKLKKRLEGMPEY